MRSSLLVFFLVLSSLSSFSQSPSLVIDRLEKRTNEHIRQTSQYLFKDGDGKTRLSFSVRAVDENYYLLLNLPVAASIKRGTEVTITMENAKKLLLKSTTEVISMGDWDVSKKMMVFELDPATEIKELLKQGVSSVTIPTSNKGTVQVSLLAADRGQIRAGLTLVQKKS
ncbi:hypothetical protein [Daejeonella sp. H1SJ63]|jgi:CYTH domain-containing protein|uniref:hypothetical protein n=1 Tax=Daejeonella sp. H1SJ63 TaxID=3034145 RepID=UPI0023ED7B95|nr:hypothetical protein [Daejeonella sp. H1SJ63]